MNKEYKITYKCFDGVWTSFSQTSDNIELLKQEYKNIYADDINFEILHCVRTINDFNYFLNKTMKSVKELCSLGHKVRSDAKIKNRQPLRKAYILFSDIDSFDYINYLEYYSNIKDKKNEYTEILKDELNVLEVEYITSTDFFVYVIVKPNFRILGPKKLGKVAQSLKLFLSQLTSEQHNSLYEKLNNNESVRLLDVDFVKEDFEFEFKAKQQFVSSNGKYGVVILDTTIDDELNNLGFIREFRSVFQNLRKECGFDITKRINVNICCNDNVKNVLEENIVDLKKYLLVNEFVFNENIVKENCNKLNVNNEEVLVGFC